jgi:hypothetical protein
MKKETNEARVIKKLVRAAKRAMNQLKDLLPESEGGQVWNELDNAVRYAERKGLRRKGKSRRPYPHEPESVAGERRTVV